MYKYSIIIPTLNEKKFLPLVLEHLNKFDEDFEIIVSDGGSSDDTVNIAKSFGVKICKGETGKGMQLNKGAECSTGKILIFLHADTFLPEDAFIFTNKLFLDSKNNIATFMMKFDVGYFLLKLYSQFTRFDSIFTTFGDQAIIIRTKLFNQLGGFAKLPIFEDVELLKRARKFNKVHKIPLYVTTSARRFEKRGHLKTQCLNGLYILEYLAGVNPDNIYKKYFRDKL